MNRVKPDHYENPLSWALCYSCLGGQAATMDWLQYAGQAARGTFSPAPF
jgi:hypothetical protein